MDLSRAVLKAFDGNLALRAGPWEKSLMSESQQTRFEMIEKMVEKKTSTANEELDLVMATIQPGEKELRARAFALYGEWAQQGKDLEAAKAFFDQALAEKDDSDVRALRDRVILNLNLQTKPALVHETSDFIPDGEAKFDERFAASQKSNDLVALADDCVSYLNRYPQGRRAKWAADKALNLYELFLDQSQTGLDKFVVLREKTLGILERADWARLGEWSRALHKRGDWAGSLRLADKALSTTGISEWNATLRYVAGRSAEFLGDDKRAQKYFEDYAEYHSAGDDIVEVLFRLGLVHLRLNEPDSAAATFERLLSTRGRNDRYDLNARYWLVRSLQMNKSPRAAEKAQEIIQKFPFSYYGLRLKAEAANGVLEWPAALQKPDDLKAQLPLTGLQKKSWDRIRALSADGWRDEALQEAAHFPVPENPRLKALLAEAWAHGQALHR
jgi:soluble lytic murein transglycosylase